MAPVAVAVLACAAYVNALNNPFVYDDHDTVVANPSLADLSNVRFILVYSPFRPVVNASYAVDRWFFGPGPFGFHLTNVLLHAIAALLLYAFLRRAFQDARAAASSPAAFAGAAVFAVHPLQTEAAGYISGRSEVMCAVWFLASLLLARRAWISGGRIDGAAAIACGALALASKETAVALPAVLFAYDWLLRPGPDDARRWRVWRVYLPIAVILAAAGVYRLAIFRSASLGFDPGTPLLNLLTQAIVVWRYVALLVWPSGQTIMHAVRRVASVADPVAWLASAGWLLVAAGAWRIRRGWPIVTFGIVWFFATLAPSSSVIALREGMAEHRMYLASAGLFICGAAAASRALERMRADGRGLPVAWRAAAGGLVIVLFALTVSRNQVWASPVALWTEAAARAEGMWEPHYALADAMREAGDCARAIPEYQKVIGLQPAHREAQTNLGICLAQTGQLEEAERAFRRTLEIDPTFVRGYTNLGALALVAGDPDRARDYYREALAQDPRNVLARMQLARLYEETFHDYPSAAQMCGEARLIAPATPGVAECMERNQRLAAQKDAGR